MDIQLIDQADALPEVEQDLATARRIALDCEAAGFHRYSDRVCLIQLTSGQRTYLLDPLALSLDELLRPFLEDPDREVIMHGADFDLRLLDRDLDIQLKGLFDTQVAASVLGIDGIGLQSLLDRTLGVELAKKYQRADWARRPLPEPMLRYAALDTVHLMKLADQLTQELEEAGRMSWAMEENRALETIRHEDSSGDDPAARLKAARGLSDREVHRLREGLAWRDELARRRDKAPFRVTNDSVLLEVARQNPSSVRELANIQGMNGALARDEGEALLDRLRQVDALPDQEVVGLPIPDRAGSGRPPPEVEERMRTLKGIRNRKAGELGIDRGTLLPNALLEVLAADPPVELTQMARVSGIRQWQVKVVGPELMDVLAREMTGSGS
jgi:ribonuclease D